MLSMIAAVQKSNRGIGYKGVLPWKIPDDMIHFKNMTLNKICVMGYKTFELDCNGIPLSNRMNVILSRTFYPLLCPARNNYLLTECVEPNFWKTYTRQMISLGHIDLPEITYDEIMICGGESIYKYFLPKVTRLYITEIESKSGEIECDRFFPDYLDWNCTDRGESKETEQFTYSFNIYEK